MLTSVKLSERKQEIKHTVNAHSGKLRSPRHIHWNLIMICRKSQYLCTGDKLHSPTSQDIRDFLKKIFLCSWNLNILSEEAPLQERARQKE